MLFPRLYFDARKLALIKYCLARLQHRVHRIVPKILPRHFSAASGIYGRAPPREYRRSRLWPASPYRPATKD
jgi:hypothetical protein